MRIERSSRQTIIDVREVNTHGESAAGQCVLLIALRCSKGYINEDDRFYLSEQRLELRSEDGQFLASGFPQGDPLNEVSFHDSLQFYFMVPIPVGALDHLERSRNGRDHLKLKLRWTGVIAENTQPPVAFNTDREFHINSQQWIQALNTMRYSDIQLIEIPHHLVSTSAADDLPGNPIQRALQHLSSADYDAAVTECRKVLEGLRINADDNQAAHAAVKALSRSPKEKKEMRLLARARAAREAIHHLCNLGPHYAEEAFTRDQARAVVMMTLAAVRFDWKADSTDNEPAALDES